MFTPDEEISQTPNALFGVCYLMFFWAEEILSRTPHPLDQTVTFLETDVSLATVAIEGETFTVLSILRGDAPRRSRLTSSRPAQWPVLAQSWSSGRLRSH